MHIQVQFVTYGKGQRPHPIDYNIIYRVDCSHLPAPPSHLCNVSTGLYYESAEAFWKHQVNQERYRKAVDHINGLLYLALSRGQRSVAVAVFCMAGMHRSVALAERLARHFVTYPGLSVPKPKHLDMGGGVKRQQERLKLEKEVKSRMMTEEKHMKVERVEKARRETSRERGEKGRRKEWEEREDWVTREDPVGKEKSKKQKPRIWIELSKSKLLGGGRSDDEIGPGRCRQVDAGKYKGAQSNDLLD